MNRRETIKNLVIGGVGATFALQSCVTDKEEKVLENPEALADAVEDEGQGYGRTPEEAARDARLKSKTFFSEHEMATIAVLADIIIPADDNYGSATDAEVPAFIEFIAKDIPEHQTPLRGGLMWLDHESNRRFGKRFIKCNRDQQIKIVDDIAYMDTVKPEHLQGATFFNRIRNLVTTGYFTSKIGLEYLGYVGNSPNVWDGVPEDVLNEHGLSYDEKMLRECIKPEERNEIMDWEEYEGNYNS